MCIRNAVPWQYFHYNVDSCERAEKKSDIVGRRAKRDDNVSAKRTTHQQKLRIALSTAFVSPRRAIQRYALEISIATSGKPANLLNAKRRVRGRGLFMKNKKQPNCKYKRCRISQPTFPYGQYKLATSSQSQH